MSKVATRVETVLVNHHTSSLLPYFFNSSCPRIVATPSEVLEQNKCRPGIVAAASKCGIRTHACEWFLITVTTLALRLFVLCKSFPQLTSGLRGCAYYWQCLTIVTPGIRILLYTLIRHHGYYSFRYSFCVVTIWGWLLFEGCVYLFEVWDINDGWIRYVRMRQYGFLTTPHLEAKKCKK